MNNPKSMLLGWGSLIVAAGVSYYYARKSINERRAVQEAMGARPSEQLDWRARIEQQEKRAAAAPSDKNAPGSSPGAPPGDNGRGGPS